MADPIMVGLLQLHVRMVAEYAWITTKVLGFAYDFLVWIVLISAIVLFWHLLKKSKREQNYHDAVL